MILQPENGDTSQAVTAGFIDVGLRAVELRTFAALDQTYQQRHKMKLDIPRAEYDAFVKELQAFLGGEGYVVKMVDVSEQEAKAAKAQAASANASNEGGGSKAPLIIAAAVVAIGVIAIAAMMVMK